MVKLCFYLNRAQGLLKLRQAYGGLLEQCWLSRIFVQDCLINSNVQLNKLYVLSHSQVDVFWSEVRLTVTTACVIFVNFILEIASDYAGSKFIALSLSHVLDHSCHPLNAVSELQTELTIRGTLDPAWEDLAAEGEGYGSDEVF